MDAVRELKRLIDKNGRNYLQDEPYLVYKELVASENADKSLAGAILMVLVDGCWSRPQNLTGQDVLSKRIQDRCYFKKKMADKLAEIFISLCSEKNEEEWKKNDLAGWREFMESEFTYHWKGFSVWFVSNGSVSCHYDADIVLRPAGNIQPDKEMSKSLKKNSFMTAEVIAEHYRKQLKECLDDEFEDYVTCDDYYEPVVEDFEAEYYVKSWCQKNGFEMLSFEGDGHDDGYEPALRSGRW